MRTKALIYMGSILALDTWYGITLLANVSFVYPLLISVSFAFYIQHRLPPLLQLILPAILYTLGIGYFLNWNRFPIQAWIFIVSVFFHLQAWGYLRAKMGFTNQHPLARKCINIAFISSLIPAYFALIGYSLKLSNRGTDKLSVILYILLAMLFLEATKRRHRVIDSIPAQKFSEKLIRSLSLLLTTAFALLIAHQSSQYVNSFIPMTVRLIQDNDLNLKVPRQLGQRSKNSSDQQNSTLNTGYNEKVQLHSKFELKKDFSSIDCSILIEAGTQHIQPNQMYLRTNRFLHYSQRQWLKSPELQNRYYAQNDWVQLSSAPPQNHVHYHLHLNNSHIEQVPLLGIPHAIKTPHLVGNRNAIKVPKSKKSRALEIIAHVPAIQQDLAQINASHLTHRYIPKTATEQKLFEITQQLTAGTSSIPKKIERLDRYLKKNFSYSDTVNNPQNLDPLENFLFHERRGHCVLYSTVYCLMLQSLGLPASVCSGYYGGRVDENTSNYHFYKGNAHTWVEVVLPGTSNHFMRFDPSPEVARRQPNSSERAAIEWNLATEITQLHNWWKRLSLRDLYQLILALSALPICIIWKWNFLKRLLPKKSKDPACLNTFYSIFQKKVPKAAHQTLREYHQSIVKSGWLATDQFKPFIHYIYAIKYHEQTRDPRLEKRFSAQLKQYRRLAARHKTTIPSSHSPCKNMAQ